MSSFTISVGVAILMFAQSVIGLLNPAIYRDNLFVKSAWYGNDMVTLLVALPVLVISLVQARRGSLYGRLICLGVLAYSFYNYSFYLFGAALNSLFLVFVALFALSGYGLVFGVTSLPLKQVPTPDSSDKALRGVSYYMYLWGTFLSALWIAQSLSFAFTGKVPAIVTATDHPTNITAALDLAMMVPAVLLGAMLLGKRRKWGIVLALVMNVKGAIYALVLAAGSMVAARAGIPDIESQIPMWLALSIASFTCCWILVKRVAGQSA